MPTFVLVGHCGPDMYLLKSAVARAVPGAAVVNANDDAALRSHLHGRSVLLINRVLDGDFDTDSGVELIEQLAHTERKPAMMLVSNLADAQAQATAAGARQGFGKSALYAESTTMLLREAARTQDQPNADA